MPINDFFQHKSNMADDLRRNDSPLGCSNSKKPVIIVMDGLKDFTTGPLKWALKNVITPGCEVIILGAMPWLNIPLSSKTWHDVWMVDFEDLAVLRERNDRTGDLRFLKLQSILDICKKYGVVPQKEVIMGYPTRLLVLERITSLHASWVVFDRHHNNKKDRDFFAKRIPYNMVMMNEEGGVDMIRGRPMIDNGDNTPGASPVSTVPTPLLMISDELKDILWEEAPDA